MSCVRYISWRLWKSQISYTFSNPGYMTFPEITGNFTCRVHFPAQGHVTFPVSIRNFTCHVHFPTQGHVTFTGHFQWVSEISCVVYISQLKDMWHFLDISSEYQKFHVSCTFLNSRICDIYWTFPVSIRNFMCHVHFPTQGHVTFTGHFQWQEMR